MLSEHTLPIRDYLLAAAVKYNVNIMLRKHALAGRWRVITTSAISAAAMAHFAQRYEKHITPNERNAWGIQGGQKVRVFDTDCGRVGVVVFATIVNSRNWCDCWPYKA